MLISCLCFSAAETPGNLNVILTKKTTHGFNRMSKILILGKNEAVRVKCGSPLPSNANAVVLIEDTLLLHRDDDVIPLVISSLICFSFPIQCTSIFVNFYSI